VDEVCREPHLVRLSLPFFVDLSRFEWGSSRARSIVSDARFFSGGAREGRRGILVVSSVKKKLITLMLTRLKSIRSFSGAGTFNVGLSRQPRDITGPGWYTATQVHLDRILLQLVRMIAFGDTI
jgi:hypothetical protein